MFATNFSASVFSRCGFRACGGLTSAPPAAVALTHLKYVRGKDVVKSYGQSETIGSPRNGHTMTEYWCDNCGRLMYRVSSGMPDLAFVRVGAVDDFSLHESILKPESASRALSHLPKRDC